MTLMVISSKQRMPSFRFVSIFCVATTLSFCTSSFYYIKFLYNANYFTGLMHVHSNLLQSREVRQTHLHWQKMGFSLCDDNLSEGETIYWL